MTYISPSKAFAYLGRLRDWQTGNTPAPVTVEWDLSNRCSLGCQDCHFAHTHSKGPWAAVPDRRLPMAFDSTGDLAHTPLVRRGLTEMAAAGVRGVVWSGGGEPTLHPDWPEIVIHAGHQGLAQGMYTLGGHLTGDQATLLRQQLTFVVVSLDAVDANTYARDKQVAPERFAAAIKGIQRLTAASGPATIGVSFLLHAGNWSDAPAMAHFARSLGADYATFRPVIDTEPDRPAVCAADRQWIARALPTLRALAAQPHVECDPDRFIAYHDWSSASRGYSTCHGIKLNATITPDGRVWVCPQRRGVAGSEIGDLRIESFATLWKRHPGQWTDFDQCRVMCRLHLLNTTLAPVFGAELLPHHEFV